MYTVMYKKGEAASLYHYKTYDTEQEAVEFAMKKQGADTIGNNFFVFKSIYKMEREFPPVKAVRLS